MECTWLLSTSVDDGWCPYMEGEIWRLFRQLVHWCGFDLGLDIWGRVIWREFNFTGVSTASFFKWFSFSCSLVLFAIASLRSELSLITVGVYAKDLQIDWLVFALVTRTTLGFSLKHVYKWRPIWKQLEKSYWKVLNLIANSYILLKFFRTFEDFIIFKTYTGILGAVWFS